MKNRIFKLLKAIITILIFFYFGYALFSLLKVFGLNFSKLDYDLALTLEDGILELVLAVIFSIMYRDKIKSGIEKLKKYKRIDRIKYLLKFVIVSYVFVMLLNLIFTMMATIISNISGIEFASSNNQNIVEELLFKYPIIMVITAVITGPYVEEIVYRGSIRDVFKNKKVFITVSGLIFGLMHITNDVFFLLLILCTGFFIDVIINSNFEKKEKIKSLVIGLGAIFIIWFGIYSYSYGGIIVYLKSLDLEELLSGFTYVGMGCGLAYIYTREDNLVNNICLHAFINAVATISILFF